MSTTNTQTEQSPLAALKAKQHVIWTSGDYNRIAALTVPVAERLVEVADPRPGDQVLDVATGTGHAALAAARRFCEVTGVDYVSALVEIARRRAAAENVDVRFEDGDAENLSFPDESFDAVFSAIGVMFTADHDRAAAELLRVCRPGGQVALASWTPEGFVGQMLRTVGRHVAPPAVAKPATRWGSPEALEELMGAAASIRCERRTVSQRFHSPEHFADFFLTYYGPTHKAYGALGADAGEALRRDLVELARDSNRALDGSLRIEWEYLIAIATKH
jgi:ubiquinone/menaquinone biosynthesis C-methylase UbiE